MLVGIIPALSASRPDSLRARGDSKSRSNRLLRDVLVSSEVALSVVLLVCAGLLFHSFQRLESADVGFQANHAVSFRLLLSDPPYPESEQARIFTDIDNRLRTLPGVEAAGASFSVPLRGRQGRTVVATVEGRDGDCDLHLGAVTPDYFRAVGTPLLRGRFFNESDVKGSLPVVIVNEAFEKAYLGSGNPVGKRFKYGRLTDTNYSWITIVGVVADQKQERIELPVQPATYRPLTQVTPPTVAFVLRGPGDPNGLVASARREIHSVYKDLALIDVATLDDLVHGSIGDQRFRTSLISVFAGLALLLAALGVYGVLAFSVAERTGEIGVRMALGAQRGDVLQLILCQGMKSASIGVGIGLMGAFASTHLMRGLLFGVGPTDPPTFFGVSLLLTTAAALACWLPARRAVRVDPMVALRYE
jgi:putative ABC transport system permease protein